MPLEIVARIVEPSKQSDNARVVSDNPFRGFLTLPPQKKIAKQKKRGISRAPVPLTEIGLTVELIRTSANLAVIARRHKVSRQAVSQYIKEHPVLQSVYDDAKEERLDVAEDSLLQAVKEREGWAVCFLLKCQGKSRGYIEHSDVMMSGTLHVKVDYA